MAEGFARSIGGGEFEVFSAGSRPAGFVSPQAVETMMELGIDISGHHSKGLSAIPQERYDVIVTMGCGDACPHIPAKRRFDWRIPDPIGGTDETFKKVGNQIENQVRALIKELHGE